MSLDLRSGHDHSDKTQAQPSGSHVGRTSLKDGLDAAPSYTQRSLFGGPPADDAEHAAAEHEAAQPTDDADHEGGDVEHVDFSEIAPRSPGGSDEEGGVQAKAASAEASAAGGPHAGHRVSYDYRDGKYGAHAEYDVRVAAKAVLVSVGVQIKPLRGVTSGMVRRTKADAQRAFKKYFNGRFTLKDSHGKKRKLYMRLLWSGKHHHAVSLHKGAGRDDAANWFVKGASIDKAHEVGHLLGLKDEYVDKQGSPNRDVHRDHSLMGNYYDEGIGKAGLKKRHGQHFARDISRATGFRFHV